MFFQKLLEEKTRSLIEISPEEFRALRSRKVADYFPDATACTDHPDAVTFEDDELKAFDADFERLLRQRSRLQGLAKAKGFRKWWGAHRLAYLTRPAVQGYRLAGLRMGELFDDLQMHFLLAEAKRQNSSRLGQVANRLVKSRITLSLVFGVTLIVSKFGLFLWSLIVLGPGVQMVNSYTQTVITPLAQTASQKGSRDLGAFAGMIQGWLSNREKLREVASQIKETNERFRKYDFKKMTAEQTKEKWAQFEDAYFKLFLLYNQTLPSHLRDGRTLFKDWMLFTPVALAANLSTFDVQYWTHRREYERVKGDARMRRVHSNEMAAAESRIAGTLAAWKLYEFMYPEFSREPANAKSRGELKQTYRKFISTMRFELYVEHFAVQIEQVLKQMDAEFLVQDRLAGISVSPDRVVANAKSR